MIKKYGASRDLTYQYHNLLQEEMEKKKDNTDSDNLIDEKNVKVNRLISSNASEYDKSHNDPSNKSCNLPNYISNYYINKNDIKSLEIKFTELKKYQDRQFIVQFNDEETKNLHRKIRKLSFQLKCDLKTTERNIKIYINEDISSPNSNDNNDLQYQIKENMSQNILKEFNMFSKKFKLNEEIYSQKCKELLIIEEDDNMLEMNDMSTNNSDSNENERNRGGGDNFLLTEEPDFVLQSRDNELNEIIRGVTNLQVVMHTSYPSSRTNSKLGRQGFLKKLT